MRQINLLPEEMKKNEALRRVKVSVVGTLVPTFLFVLLIHCILSYQIEDLERVMHKPSNIPETPVSMGIRNEMENLQEEAAQFVDGNRDIIETFVRDVVISDILKVIGDAASDRVWLTRLTHDMEKRFCRIDGVSSNTRLVGEFMLKLKQVPYFEGVELVSVEQGRGKGKKELDFRIICNFRE